MVQLVGPVGVIRVLKLEPLGQRHRQGDFAAVLATARRKALTGSSCWRRAV